MSHLFHPSTTRTEARTRLYHRAVLWEGQQRDRVFQRIWRATGGHFHRLSLPRVLTPEQEFYYPDLAQVRAYGGEPRWEDRPAGSFIGKSHRMYEQHGTLVMLTQRLPHLDGESLYWSHGRRALVSGSKWAMTGLLSVRGKDVRSMLTVIERDFCGRTHAHGLTHLSGLCARYREALLLAPRGKGGGVELDVGLHGVIVGDTVEDRECLARYLRKWPDGRCRLPRDHDLHLEMLNEIAEHMICGEDDEEVQLMWRFPQDWRPGRRLT